MGGMRIKIFICVVFLSCVHAQMLTWSDCEQQASGNNTTIRIARENLVQAQESLNAARALFWPQISAGASTQHAENTLHDPVQTTKSDSVGYTLSVKQDVFDGFKTLAQAQAAEKSVQAAEYDFFVTNSNVRLALRNAFITVLKAQEQKALVDIIVARRSQDMALIKLRYDGGREHKGALLLARANLDQAEADVAQATRTITLAQRKLSSLLGVSLEQYTVTENQGVFAVVSPNFEEIAVTNPQLQLLQAKLDAAKYSATAVKASQLPQVYASYQTGKSGNSWPPENASWSLGGNLAFTLFDGNANGATMAKAESAIAQADLQVLDGRQTIVLTLAQTWTDLENAREDLAVKQSFLVAAQERSRIANAQYAAGLLLFDNWSIIEDALVNAEKAMVNARASVLTAEATWVQACGGGLDAQ